MEKKLDKIEEKIDSVNEKLAKTNEILAVNTESLKHHILRTQMLEERVEPLEKSYQQANGVIKLFTYLSILATVVDVVYRLIHHS